jgi:hypothetical protein
MEKSLQDQQTKDGTKLPDLSPNLHHVPPLNKDVNETAIHKENKTKPAV